MTGQERNTNDTISAFFILFTHTLVGCVGRQMVSETEKDTIVSMQDPSATAQVLSAEALTSHESFSSLCLLLHACDVCASPSDESI